MQCNEGNKTVAELLDEAVAQGFDPTKYECAYEVGFELARRRPDVEGIQEPSDTINEVELWLATHGIVLRGHPVGNARQ